MRILLTATVLAAMAVIAPAAAQAAPPTRDVVVASYEHWTWTG
jgi:hypothetical protein